MNVVLLPALVSTLADADLDGLLCTETSCLLGWAWLLAALALLSAWVAGRWPVGFGPSTDLLARLAPAIAGSAPRRMAELLPRLEGGVPPTREPRVRPGAGRGSFGLALRAPPPSNDMAAAYEPSSQRRSGAARAPSPSRTVLRSPGTPNPVPGVFDAGAESGQSPPA
jgi:hypothetical protein